MPLTPPVISALTTKLQSCEAEMGKNLSGDLEKKKTQAKKVRELREKVEEKLVGPDMKASLADYIRLVQLQQELEEEIPRDIQVTWIEPKKDPEK